MKESQANQLLNEAISLLQFGAPLKAEKILKRLDAALPSTPSILYFLGVTASLQDNKQHAIKYYDRVLRLQPQFIEAYSNRGLDLNALGRHQEAADSFARAIALRPDFIEAYLNLGVVFNDMCQFEAALQQFQQALLLRPDCSDALTNQGCSLIAVGRYQEAKLALQRALELNPADSKAYCSFGLLYTYLKKYDSASRAYARAIQVQPDCYDAKFSRAILNLSLMRFEEGWKEFNYRWQQKNRFTSLLNTFRPVWDGIDCNQRILVWSEQGVGDQVLFCSILPELARRIPKLLIRVEPKLWPLFRRSFPDVEIIPADAEITDERFDAHIAMGELPAFFRRSAADFMKAGSGGYLRASEDLQQQIAMQLPRSDFRVGLSWTTSGQNAAERTLPLSQLLEALKECSVDQYVDLQYTDTAKERADIEDETGIRIHKLESVDNFNNLDALAALINCCDVVVTCSNTTAHLAGALGKETHLLVPYSKGCHWYWNHKIDGQSLWYPSIRIYQQSAMGDWSGPIAELVSMLSSK